MGIQNISEDIILAELPAESQHIAAELKEVNEKVCNSNCDVIIDFSRVEIINSANISNLLILRSLLNDSGNQLVFCNVAMTTKCIFVVAGLNEVFIFADSKSSAVSAIQSKKSSVNTNS